MQTRMLFTHALSPLHAGTGQGVGIIDLPIAREKATGLPFLPGSSVKGSLRDQAPDNDQHWRVFGPKTDRAEEFASSVQFSDQRLLALPVRSLAGTFAWVTSPYILHRLKRDATDTGNSRVANLNEAIPTPAFSDDTQECFVAFTGSRIVSNEKVYLEDLDLTATTKQEATDWATEIGKHIFPDANDAAWRTAVIERFCIVPDDVMSFLIDTATEINARIKMSSITKTVDQDVGGLWYEESLPCETLLYGLVFAAKIKASSEQEVFDVVTALIKDKPVQLGGKATVGRGLCRLRLS